MKIVIFGLTVSSSWGNGHATLWRALLGALARQGHDFVFYERDVPYYAGHRDLHALPGGRLVLYDNWAEARQHAAVELDGADAGIVTSYCPDGVAATELLIESRAHRRLFYDLDTPVTLAHLRAGEPVSYIGPRRLADFDLVLSFTGGAALEALADELGARRVAPLYGSVDPAIHRPTTPERHYQADLSYLGTYAQDRQRLLEELLVEPARRTPERRFLIGGAQYPQDFPWAPNIYFVRHLPPSEHPAFFSSSRFTLNITRKSMAEMGWCPSGRLFEAAACGVPILSDQWPGLDAFFEPGREILTVSEADQTIAALGMDEAERLRLARAARNRVLAEHTSDNRAAELVAAIESTAAPRRAATFDATAL